MDVYGRLYRRLNFSILPAVSIMRCPVPVKNGWQLEQISIEVSPPNVDIVFHDAPHEHLKIVALYSG